MLILTGGLCRINGLGLKCQTSPIFLLDSHSQPEPTQFRGQSLGHMKPKLRVTDQGTSPPREESDSSFFLAENLQISIPSINANTQMEKRLAPQEFIGFINFCSYPFRFIPFYSCFVWEVEEQMDLCEFTFLLFLSRVKNKKMVNWSCLLCSFAQYPIEEIL